MRRFSLAIFLLLVFDLSALDKQLVKDAKKFAKEAQAVDWDLIRPEDFIAEEERGVKFDPSDFEGKEIPDSDIYKFVTSDPVKRNLSENKGFTEDEGFIRRSEEILEKEGSYEIEYQEEGIYEIKKCHTSGDPFAIAFNRTLEMDVHYEPEIRENRKICLGHHKKKHYSSHSTAKKKYKQKNAEFAADASLKSYNVDLSGGGSLSKYTLKYSWNHMDNIASCNNFREETKVLQPERFSISNEHWKVEGSSEYELSQTPRCTLIDQTCVDANTTKVINGKEITRRCWKERLSYICTPDKRDECGFLKSSYCDEAGRKCLKQGPFGCELWEFSYRCLTGTKRTLINVNADDIVSSDEDLWDTEYQINDAFPEVATKLSVFEQIKDEIAKTEKLDATRVSIFKGNKQKCEKSVADNIFYDCCFSMGGLATQLKLSHCTADEIALAEAEEAGRCHYVGEKELSVVGVKTGVKHVFCCFPSKLARVFQEQSREQLNIAWGSASRPNCAGLKMKDLSRIDFTKIDLKEVYAESLQRTAELEQKLEQFQDRLVQELESEREKFESKQ